MENHESLVPLSLGQPACAAILAVEGLDERANATRP